jgi:MraZ protein
MGPEEQAMSAADGKGLLLGRFDHALDPKKRLTIPSNWRELMGHPAYVYVMPDLDQPCLNLLAPRELERRLEGLRQRALFEDGLGEMLAELGEHAEQLPLDVQGRIRIRDRLLEFAQLSDQVVMIGAANRVQLWAPKLRPERASVDQGRLASAYRNVKF